MCVGDLLYLTLGCVCYNTHTHTHTNTKHIETGGNWLTVLTRSSSLKLGAGSWL